MKQIIILKTKIFIFVFICNFYSNAQSNNNYTFYLYESFPSETSMKKRAINFTSSYRFVHNIIKTDSLEFWKKMLVDNTLYLSQYLLMGVTHEEGHRSVLTTNNIGSISHPFFDKNGIASVIGVLDTTIINLRNNNLPSYIRLYTSGLESDFFIIENCNELISFDEDEVKNVLPSIIIRNTAIFSYYLTTAFPKLSPEIKENSDQLENDIVGHDLYGAVKNMHRPYSPFKRYTNYSDLIENERNHLNQMALSSLLNFLSPTYLKFKINKNTIRIGTGYTLTPFGELYKLSFWLKSKQKIGLNFLLYKTANNYGKGVNFIWKNVNFNKKISFDFRGSIFQQPENLRFFDTKMFIGGHINTRINYRFKNISLFLSHTYKTKGFIVGESYLIEKNYLNFGTTLHFKKNNK